MTEYENSTAMEGAQDSSPNILELCRNYLSAIGQNVSDNDVISTADLLSDETTPLQLPPNCDEFGNMFNNFNMVKTHDSLLCFEHLFNK